MPRRAQILRSHPFVVEQLRKGVHAPIRQHHCGTPGRGRYHNKEWAEKMKALGLLPTSTDEEGGVETGEKVHHLIASNGAFERAANFLLHGHAGMSWVEIPKAAAPSAEEPVTRQKTSKSGNRVSYVCPACASKAWAKHEASLVCGEHMVPMMAADAE